MIRLLFIITLLFINNAKAEITAKDFHYKSCNHHKFTFLLLKVYDIYLCVNDKNFQKPQEIYKTNFSVIINYNMNFEKEELSQSSIEEMNRYYKLNIQDQDSYYQQLLSIFPNVQKGDIIEAKYYKNGITEFYHNKELKGQINNREFSEKFLDIWLYKENKYKKMTRDLFTINSNKYEQN